MKNNIVLAIVFLMAGTLLTTTAITTMVLAAYADNKQKAEDESVAAIADCDHNDVEQAGFDCVAAAVNDADVEVRDGGGGGGGSNTEFVCLNGNILRVNENAVQGLLNAGATLGACD